MANKLVQNPVEVYYGISHTVLSIARQSGGAKINGSEYLYFPDKNALVRDDLIKVLKKYLKSGSAFEDFFKKDGNGK